MRIFLVAGEPSGDRLGAALMAGLRTLLPDTEIRFEGVGGPLMEAQGLQSLFPMSDISVMGVSEILSQYRALKARVVQTAEAVVAARPDVLITIDLPEFCLRVAKIVKSKSSIRTVHYVAPTVWAWRPGRARKMARHIDHVLALLPFEPPYMEAEGIRCDFVGHPVVTEPVADAETRDAFRARHGFGDRPLLLVLPGSRKSEVTRLGDIFGETVRLVRQRHPRIGVVVPAAPSVAGLVTEIVGNWPEPALVLDGGAPDALAEKRAAFGAADLALAASGTVSLELAAADTPMVIGYDMSWLSRQIIGRMVQVDTVTLVNLVSETRSVPEYIGPNCQPDSMAGALLDLLKDPERQKAAMRLTMERLGRGGTPPGQRAAQAVLDGIAQSPDRAAP
ncbi:lipid-A-disaccharide synthase [Primorskyibacter aestuariivivens]|uniref:lipid-A-disaccharide synthase n=1 Tax=Primorskyibacter aestuariivivens TaxID=1888912 RepID=UPI0023001E81|nr:lipid-A-disaccharide synthase [Primorskyibacter aestuariivivens]MDA7430779.1 lipid-A-disaccharide synthase [Primorskyibacter aestuariivivens]